MNNKELYNFIEESSIVLDDFFGLLPYGNGNVISTYNTKFGGADKRVFSITIHTNIEEMDSEDLSHEVAKFVNNVKRFNKSIAHITTELTERLDGNERYHEDYYDSSELGTKILSENEYLKEEDFHKFLTDSYEYNKKLSEVFPKTYTLYNMITMQISIYVDRDDSMNDKKVNEELIIDDGLYDIIEDASVGLDDVYGLLPTEEGKKIEINTYYYKDHGTIYKLYINTDIEELKSRDLSTELTFFVKMVLSFMEKNIGGGRIQLYTMATDKLDHSDDDYEYVELYDKWIGVGDKVTEDDISRFLSNSYDINGDVYTYLTLFVGVYVPKDFSSIYKNESGNDYLKHTNLYHLNNMTTIDGWRKWNKRSADFCRELGKEVLKDKKRKRRIKRFKE